MSDHRFLGRAQAAACLLAALGAMVGCRVRSTAVAAFCGADEDCDDGVACTEDLCDDSSTCAALPRHDRCPPGQVCDASFGCTAGSPCDAAADCDDGWFCNGIEVCEGDCRAGASPSCQESDDGLDCTVERCDAALDACTSDPTDALCDDGLFCNGSERCDVAAGCVAGTLACDDGNPCTMEFCDEAVGGCVVAPIDADGDGWTIAAAPSGEPCGGGDCDDSDPGTNPASVEFCAGGGDEDCDGRPNCADPGCWGIGDCPAGGCSGTCDAPFALTGPAETHWGESTNMEGATTATSCWCGLPGYDGPEVVYRFSVPCAGPGQQVTARLSDPSADLDIFLLYLPGGSTCDPAACIAMSATPGTSDEFIDVAVIGDGDYYLVIDGRGGAAGTYDLSWGVGCPSGGCCG